jgi:hypothetical protein
LFAGHGPRIVPSLGHENNRSQPNTA